MIKAGDLVLYLGEQYLVKETWVTMGYERYAKLKGLSFLVRVCELDKLYRES